MVAAPPRRKEPGPAVTLLTRSMEGHLGGRPGPRRGGAPRHGLFTCYEACIHVVGSQRHHPPGPRVPRRRVEPDPAIVPVYLPPDANTLLSTYDHCARSRHYVTVVVAGKHPQSYWLDAERAALHCGAISVVRAGPRRRAPVVGLRRRAEPRRRRVGRSTPPASRAAPRRGTGPCRRGRRRDDGRCAVRSPGARPGGRARCR
jgi:hypothetical protein